MSFSVGIEDAVYKYKARVTNRGQLVTAPLAYSRFYAARTVVANTPVNVIEPVTGKDFLITAIILAGERTVSVNGAVVTLFENEIGPTDTTQTSVIYSDDVARQTRAILTNLNIIVHSGRWVNVTSDSVNVRANIAGYYIADGNMSLS